MIIFMESSFIVTIHNHHFEIHLIVSGHYSLMSPCFERFRQKEKKDRALTSTVFGVYKGIFSNQQRTRVAGNLNAMIQELLNQTIS